MFDFGMGELIVIFVVALLVVGPEKLPGVARSLGKGLATLKKSLDDVKGNVQTEFNEIKDTSGIKEAISSGAELKQSLQNMTEQVKSDVKNTMDVSVKEASVGNPIKTVKEPAEGKTEDTNRK